VLAVAKRHQDVTLDVALLVAAEVLVLAALAPAEAFRNVLPYGSDHTGHPYNVSELAANLRHFRLTGWSQGWFAGFPTGVLYPVLAPGIAAAASLVLPLAVAYKLTVLTASLLLPVCAYLAGRMARLPRGYPLLLAVFTVPFLFDVSCNVCGGPVESTMVGEYAYAWGLACGVLALGAAVALCQGHGSRWWPPLLIGLAALGHPVTALWAAAGILLILGHAWWFQRRPPVRAVIPLVLALLLAAVWWLPFLADHQYMPEPIEGKFPEYLAFLFPASWPWELVLTLLAAGGAYWAYRSRQLLLAAVASLTVLTALAFRFLPVSQLPNWRVIELWYLGRWMLAAVALAEGARWLVARLPLLARRLPGGRVGYGLAGVALLVVALTQGVPWGLWPGEQLVSEPVAHERWLGINFPAVLQSEFAGEMFAGAAADGVPQYGAMVAMLKAASRRYGCGRLAFDEDYYGGTLRFYDALDSLPLITDGCLTTITGTLLDSGDNTPEVFVTESLVSSYPQETMPNIPYLQFNLPLGISDLRQLGVTYYLTHGGTAAAAARRQPGLQLVGSTAQVQLWRISGAAIVTPLRNRPVVATDLPARNVSWLSYSLDYAVSPDWGTIVQTQSGPATWSRVPAGTLPSAVGLPRVAVRDVSVTDSAISFTVSRTGVPVEIRDSYFPGWQVDGASGPYRAMPDFMVVVPTSKHVTLVYATTTVITTAHVLGALGLLGAVALGVADWRRRQAAPVPAASPVSRPGARPGPRSASRVTAAGGQRTGARAGSRASSGSRTGSRAGSRAGASRRGARR
jgi:hypothetical protein